MFQNDKGNNRLVIHPDHPLVTIDITNSNDKNRSSLYTTVTCEEFFWILNIGISARCHLF